MRPIVQHPKIASLTPVWAAFAGYSFICDQSDAPVDRHTFAVCKETITAFNTVEAALAKFGEGGFGPEAISPQLLEMSPMMSSSSTWNYIPPNDATSVSR